ALLVHVSTHLPHLGFTVRATRSSSSVLLPYSLGLDRRARLDHCVIHGLRKAATRRLAEAGCTTMQIMAVREHKSHQEVDHHTQEAAQQHSAREAIRKLKRRTGNKDSQTST